MQHKKIICDYCGSVIDISLHDRCPGCGAAYGHDEEWKQYQKSQDTARAKNKKPAPWKKPGKGRLRPLMLSAVAAAAVLIAAGIGVFVSGERDYTRSDKLNEYSFEHYEEAGYAVKDGGVILNYEGVRVTAEGFYLDQDDYSKNVKIACVIENGSGQDIRLSFSRVGINGLADSDKTGYIFGHFKKGSRVTLYDWVYDIHDVNLREIVYGKFSLSADDGGILFEKNGCTRITTDCPEPPEAEIPEGKTVYDNGGITLVSTGKHDDRYTVWINNSTDYDYLVTSSDMRINGERISSYGLYDEVLPAGYIMKSGGLSSYDDAFANIRNKDSVEVSLSFRCEENPEADFSTGYLKIQ